MGNNHVVLDVRAHLKNKLEPFELIMNTVKSLKREDVFILHATLKPTPLLGILKLKGFANKVEKLEDEHWVTTFVHKSQKHLLESLSAEEPETAAPMVEKSAPIAPTAQGHQFHYLDNQGLEPPQPMIRTLAQLERMHSGDVLVITNDRVPVFLIEELKQLGCTFDIEELPGEKARITIKKP